MDLEAMGLDRMGQPMGKAPWAGPKFNRLGQIGRAKSAAPMDKAHGPLGRGWNHFSKTMFRRH